MTVLHPLAPRALPALLLSLAAACSMAGEGEAAPQAAAPAPAEAAPASSSAAIHRSWALGDTPLDRTAAELRASTKDHLARARKLYERVLRAQGPRTVDNTLAPLNLLSMHLDAASLENDLFSNVHPHDLVREAADEGLQELSRFQTELSLDRALYDAIAAVDLGQADADLRYAVLKDLRNFRRAGVDKTPEQRAAIAALNDELTKIGQEFKNNIAAGTRRIALDSPDRLAGLPADYIAAHPPGEDGSITIDTTYPDYQPFIKYARDGEARRELYLAYTTRAWPENMKVLDRLIEKREKKAHLLGYPSWAEYITEDKMIGSARAAQEFIDRIAAASRPAAQRDLAVLLERKRQDDPAATRIEDWEKTYYSNLVMQEQYDLDPLALRPYFDFADVQQGLFDVMSRLFGVSFVPVQGLALWHQDVTAWDLRDGDGGEVLGRFYLDLHPRRDKYQHAACFPYRSGIAGARLPQAVLVCNFPNPRTSPDGTAFMEFSQVETFFHEFGHLLHHLFAATSPWSTNAGISNEWDFVEAPSQMLEEFLYDTETLQSFARHHATGEPIPAEMVAKLRAAADFGKGINAAHQMFYAALSLGCYSQDAAELDTDEVVREMQAKYSPFPYVAGAHFQCSFGHLDGYSAIYYTYMWSEVIAKDLFSRFEAEGVTDPAIAASYRRSVLAPGSTRPAAELVADFLGRPYDFAAFQRWLERR